MKNFNDFHSYQFVKTDESIKEMNHDEYYFELEHDEQVNRFMEEFDINLHDFNLCGVGVNDTFVGLDFQLSLENPQNMHLHIGPIFKTDDGYTTIDVIDFQIDGLIEHLSTLI